MPAQAKTATALLIGVLEYKGLIDLDTPIAKYAAPHPPHCRRHCPRQTAARKLAAATVFHP